VSPTASSCTRAPSLGCTSTTRSLGLTQAEVAQRMGVRQERVSAIERARPGATGIRTLATYIEALGGRLQILAEFGRENVPLR
jgi:transcriptional regulator with XRE-family HTH domain